MTEKLMTVREAPAHLEVLTAIHNGAEHWEPYATVYVRARMLEMPDGSPFPRGSLAEELEREGWIPPEDDLAGYVCDVPAPESLVGAHYRCLRRFGHEGPHQRPGFTWDRRL